MRFLVKCVWGVLLVCCTSINLLAQTLTVDPSYTPQQLVQDVLTGAGVQISNVQFTGDPASHGYFDGSNSNIGLNSGVILSTGRAVDAEGPNNGSSPTGDEGTEFFGGGDAALASITGVTMLDASILEFDFTPSSDTVQFRYAFASNEYMVWVDGDFDDAFAFFVSGPGIAGEENIALIPGTSTPVTIDNVNANVNAQYYIDNENPAGETVEYNGFTTVFTSTAILTKCETYHIRLVIADGEIGNYDSSVFLEAGSFTSPSIALSTESTYSISGNNEELVEGCSSLSLTFERTAPYDSPLTVGVNYSGTATAGVDFSNIPSSIIFGVGEGVATIDIAIYDDGVSEGVETGTISLDLLTCASALIEANFSIQDLEPLVISVSPDVTFPCPQDYTIDVVTTAGYPPFEYDWVGTTGTGSSVTVSPLETTMYGVYVTDGCGTTVNESVLVNTSGYQPLQINLGDVVVCGGEDAALNANVTGGKGNISYLWDGSVTDEIYTFASSVSTTVTLRVTDDCGITEDTIIEVFIDELVASFTQELVRYNAVQFQNTTPNTYDTFWEFGDDSTGMAIDPRHFYADSGTYIVTMTVINENGCEDTTQQEVTVYAPLHVYIPNSFTPNGDDLNESFGVVGEGYLYYDFEVYDRWGKVLVSGRFTDEEAWDGTYNGNLVPADVYVYKVFVQPPIGIEIRETGTIRVLSGE